MLSASDNKTTNALTHRVILDTAMAPDDRLSSVSGSELDEEWAGLSNTPVIKGKHLRATQDANDVEISSGYLQEPQTNASPGEDADATDINSLGATVAELQRKLVERGKLLRASEELRAALTKENRELKKANAQLRYMSTPAPFEEQYLIKARGTPPRANKKRGSAVSLPVRTSSRVAKRTLEAVDNPEPKPRWKLARTNTAPSDLGGSTGSTIFSLLSAGPVSSSSSTSTLRDSSASSVYTTQQDHPSTSGGLSHDSLTIRDMYASGSSFGGSEAAVSSSLMLRAPSYGSTESNGEQHDPGLTPISKGKRRAREEGDDVREGSIPNSKHIAYFASESGLRIQRSSQGRKILPVTVLARDPSLSHLPWFDDPTIPILPRSTEDLHGDFKGLESSQMIDAALATMFGKPGAAAKCNAGLVLILKKLFDEAGVPMASFRWAILARILFENRLRWVGWPVEINHDPKPHERPAGIPGSLRAGEMHLLKRVLARRFPPYVNSGLRLVKWDLEEMEKDFPPLFITTDGGRHNLKETMARFIADDKTLLFSRGVVGPRPSERPNLLAPPIQPRVWMAPPSLILPLSSHVLSPAT
ncbi:hypothetical protein FRB95_007096 [Tulasnella sp. JGI-2019a]|nr:hypothetical protein FRB95_007096 [Tulasnella sp. JGI-2019a]